MSIKLDKYTPLMMYLSPASIPQIVAHIQNYLVKHPILSVETIAEIIVQSLQEHPELINGEAIPISADSEQSIKAYIDALPALDTYTKAEIQTLLLGKQDTLTFDQAPTPGSSNPVTSSGIIAAMSALQSALETQINNKADRTSTYTKTQVDTLLEDKADADDVYSKNTMDAKLLEVNTGIDNLEDDLSHQSQQINDLEKLAGNTTLPTTAQTLTGAIAELKASKLPYFSQFGRLTTPIPHDGTIYEYIVPEDGYYAAIATNSSVEGICFVFFLNDADSSSYISAGYAGTGSYIRASTAYLPLKQGMRIYIRCNSTSEAYLMKGVV